MGRSWIVRGIVLAVIAGAAAGGGIWWSRRGHDYPSHWDARILPLVKYVERTRGLTFDHPVYVDFLSDTDFNEKVTKKESQLSDKDKADLKNAEAEMRALGLLAPKTDLLSSINDLQSGGIVGLYDPEDKRIRVRGSELTLDVKATLVHELTHVLQDQHFDLEGKDKRFEKSKDSEAASAWKTIVEGDAQRVEDKWESELPTDQRQQLVAIQVQQEKTSRKALAKVPTFLRTDLASSYQLGEAFLALASAENGSSGVDDVFREPPTDGEQLLDPWTYLADHQGATEVPVPDVDKGDKVLDDATPFGAPDLAFVLAERIDPKTALVAADGWGGDETVAYRHGNQTCMRMDYVGDTATDTAELSSALHQWIAAGPAGVASVAPHGKGLRFTACDAGGRTRLGDGGSMQALELASARALTATQLVKQQAPTTFVRCYLDKVLDRYGVTMLDDARMRTVPQSDFAAIAQSCRS